MSPSLRCIRVACWERHQERWLAVQRGALFHRLPQRHRHNCRQQYLHQPQQHHDIHHRTICHRQQYSDAIGLLSLLSNGHNWHFQAVFRDCISYHADSRDGSRAHKRAQLPLGQMQTGLLANGNMWDKSLLYWLSCLTTQHNNITLWYTQCIMKELNAM